MINLTNISIKSQLTDLFKCKIKGYKKKKSIEL